MSALRALIRGHRHLALLLLALALCLKAAIPAGTMLEQSGTRSLSIAICADGSGIGKAVQIALPAKPALPGSPRSDHGLASTSACGFAGLGLAALPLADPPLLALALVAIALPGLVSAAARTNPPAPFLRPPLRGPPAIS